MLHRKSLSRRRGQALVESVGVTFFMMLATLALVAEFAHLGLKKTVQAGHDAINNSTMSTATENSGGDEDDNAEKELAPQGQ